MIYEALTELLMAWMMAACIQFALWLYQESSKNATIVDIGWTLTNAWLACFYALVNDNANPTHRAAIATMACLWAFRLAYHLGWNRLRHRGEDARYAFLRKAWASEASTKFFFLFQIQALISVALSISFLAALYSPFEPLLIIGAALIFVMSFAGQSLADLQLQRFKSHTDNDNRVCRVGLWDASRHPNYFFEWLHWCAYPLIALSSPLALVAALGPALMYYLMRYHTGVPPVETRALKLRKEAFEQYQKEVPVFFPRWKKLLDPATWRPHG